MSVKQILKLAVLIFALFIVGLCVECGYETAYRLIYGKASYSTEAVFRVPNSNAEIVLSRRCIHLYFAEYERALILRVNGKDVLRRDAAIDSGGYSRMRIYRISPTRYFLQGALGFDKHEIDVAAREIESFKASEKLQNARYVGVFDYDEEGGWRFVSAFARPELDVKAK